MNFIERALYIFGTSNNRFVVDCCKQLCQKQTSSYLCTRNGPQNHKNSKFSIVSHIIRTKKMQIATL